MILLGRAYQNILFGNLNISGKISYSRPLSFNTFVYQTSLFEKIVYQNWSIFVWLIAGYVVCARIIPYAICLCGDQQLHTPSCTWMPRTSPPWSSTQGISARTSPCSPFQWPRHLSAWFVQWSNKLHIWYQMNFIWCKNCFLKAYLQIYFFTCFIIYFPWSWKMLTILFMNL